MSLLLRSLRTFWRVFSREEQRWRKARLTKSTKFFGTLQDAHPNLQLTYERARQKEASIVNDANGVINKVAAALAFVGIIVVGLLTAIDRLAWGFIQDHSARQAEWIFWPNILQSLMWLALACKTVPQLISVYKSTLIMETWGPELSQPERTLIESPDVMLIRLLKDMNFANRFNSEQVFLRQRALEKALVNLLIIAVLIVVQIGYNSAWKIALEAQSQKRPEAPWHFTNPPSINPPKPAIQIPAPNLPQSQKAKIKKLSLSISRGRNPSRSTPAGSASAPGVGNDSR